MTYTLIVDCITNVRTRKAKKNNLEKIKLPKPDKDGCSSIPQTDIPLPNGQVFEVNCEMTNYGNTLGLYEKGAGPYDVTRLLGIKSDGVFTIAYRVDEATEIAFELIK